MRQARTMGLGPLDDAEGENSFTRGLPLSLDGFYGQPRVNYRSVTRKPLSESAKSRGDDALKTCAQKLLNMTFSIKGN